MDRHSLAVQVISDRVRQFYKSGDSFRIYHGHTVRQWLATFALMLPEPIQVLMFLTEFHTLQFKKQRQSHRHE